MLLWVCETETTSDPMMRNITALGGWNFVLKNCLESNLDFRTMTY